MKILLSDLEYRTKLHPEYLEKILKKGNLVDGFIQISHLDYTKINAEHIQKIKKTQTIPTLQTGIKPGDLLASTIKKITGIKPCSNCNKRQEQMNEWGWWGCWRNRKIIIEWLCEEAKKRGFEITKLKARHLFKMGFSELFLQNVRPTRSSEEPNHEFYKTKEGKLILEYVRKNLNMLEIDEKLIQKSNILPSHLETFLAYWNTPVFVRSTKLLRRLFHSVVQIPKESRKFLRLRKTKEHPIEVDFPQTFPTLLLYLYDDVNCPEAEKYKELLSSRKFYDTVTQVRLPHPKGAFMKFLFSRHAEPESLTWKLITEFFQQFPILYEKIIKVRGPEFSVTLQNLEAEIFIASVIPSCRKENIFVIPIHDGYFLLEEDLPKVQNFLDKSLRERINYAPTLRKKDHEPNNANEEKEVVKTANTETKNVLKIEKERKNEVIIMSKEESCNSCPSEVKWNVSKWEANLKNYFDRIVLINLDRRPDRIEEFKSMIDSIDFWPFKNVERFSAIDSWKVPTPRHWVAGGGAWGCMQSHRRVLEQAIQDGVKRLLVLEDDVVFVKDFGSKISRFLKQVPEDWDQLMIGGQYFHDSEKEEISEGVHKVQNYQRTHCYAVQGKYLKDLYSKWCSSSGHCDHIMGWFQRGYKVFAPHPFLAGQRSGKSDISGADNPNKFWTAPSDQRPIHWLKSNDRNKFEELIKEKYHSGRIRDNETGVDVGLLEIATLPECPIHSDNIINKLRDWISMIEWESVSLVPERECLIWCPSFDESLIRKAVGERLKIIE